MLTLYHASHPTCSQKVCLCRVGKGLEWEGRLVNGVVLTLVHDGRVILNSGVICECPDEVFPAPPL